VAQPSAPRRNRVTPMGDIVAAALRGAWLGNRGILHRDGQVARFHANQLWITCVLRRQDRRLPQWAPGHYTVLFFHDEAVSLAAGHRPCALCRRAAYGDYRRAWTAALGGPVPLARDIDRRLHAERLVAGSHRRRLHAADWPQLPPGAFVLLAGGPALVLAGAVVPWTTAGYGPRQDRPAGGTAELITPPASVAALRAGYRPQIDAGALADSRGSTDTRALADVGALTDTRGPADSRGPADPRGNERGGER
jgi:hypothetical protein